MQRGRGIPLKYAGIMKYLLPLYTVSLTANLFYNVLHVAKICDVSLNLFPAKYNEKRSIKLSP